MTKNSKFPTNFDNFNQLFIGFDHLFENMTKFHDGLTKNIPNYPPYNIKKIDDTKYAIELAVAGFGKSDIEIEFVGDKLIIKGNAKDDSENSYLYKGISTRAFTRTFNLNETIEIKGAEMFNGILQIVLESIIPEHKKPSKIEIK